MLQFDEGQLLINVQDETHLSDQEFKEILETIDLKKNIKKFSVALATYLWEVAKSQTKIIHANIDEQIELMKTRANKEAVKSN